MKSAVVLALGTVALGAPVSGPEIRERQFFPGQGSNPLSSSTSGIGSSGSGSPLGSSLSGLTSSLPKLGGSGSGLSSRDAASDPLSSLTGAGSSGSDNDNSPLDSLNPLSSGSGSGSGSGDSPLKGISNLFPRDAASDPLSSILGGGSSSGSGSSDSLLSTLNSFLKRDTDSSDQLSSVLGGGDPLKDITKLISRDAASDPLSSILGGGSSSGSGSSDSLLSTLNSFLKRDTDSSDPLSSVLGGGDPLQDITKLISRDPASDPLSSFTGSGSDSSGSLPLGSLKPSGSGSDSNSGSDSSGSSSGSGSGSGLGSIMGSGSGGSSTENGVKDNKQCQPLTFIFARGTSEMGNMGSVVGPPVAKQLSSLMGGKVTVQGVDYPADAGGNANMGASGGPKMASMVKQALSQCPQTKVVLGGYSQGSMVVHNAAKSLSADQISAAVLFGDPLKTQSVGQLSDDKRKEFCAQGDPVCANGANTMAHLSYGDDAQEAASFLVQASGAKGA